MLLNYIPYFHLRYFKTSFNLLNFRYDLPVGSEWFRNMEGQNYCHPIPSNQNKYFFFFFFILYKICKIHTLLPRCINIWILEPVGLFKNNGKRSDSATQDPSQLEEWKKFRLALDWTCVDTLATSHDCINNVESSRLSSRRGWAKKDFEWPEQNVTEHNIIYLTRFWRL